MEKNLVNMKKLTNCLTQNHIFVSHMQAMRKILNYMAPKQVFQLHSVAIAS